MQIPVSVFDTQAPEPHHPHLENLREDITLQITSDKKLADHGQQQIDINPREFTDLRRMSRSAPPSPIGSSDGFDSGLHFNECA